MLLSSRFSSCLSSLTLRELRESPIKFLEKEIIKLELDRSNIILQEREVSLSNLSFTLCHEIRWYHTGFHFVIFGSGGAVLQILADNSAALAIQTSK